MSLELQIYKIRRVEFNREGHTVPNGDMCGEIQS